jgi:hypothetical protein
MDGQGALSWILQLGRTYGWELTSVVVLAVILIFVLQKVVQIAAEKAVERAFAREAKIFELVAGRRSSFVQKLQADRWEAINDFIIDIERITTNVTRSRKGIEVADFFKVESNGTRDIVPLTAVFEELEGKRSLLGEEFHRILHERAFITLRYAQAESNDYMDKFISEKVSNTSDLDKELDRVFRLTTAYIDKD